MSKDPLHSLQTEVKKQFLFPCLLTKTGSSEVRLKVKLGSGSPLLGHQGPSEWLGHFWVYGFFFLEITMLQSGFQNQSKTTNWVREQVCPGALTRVLGVAGSAPHV